MGILSQRKCLAIVGAAGSGKDTVATMVNEYLFGTADKRLNQIKFSKPLKEMTALIFGWDVERMDEMEYKEERLDRSIPSPWDPEDAVLDLHTRREVLQFLGTDIFRVMSPDCWARAAIREAEESVMSFDPLRPRHFVSTDCRFPNEQEILKETFEDVMFIRLRKTNPDDFRPIANAGHESECAIDALDTDAKFSVKAGDRDSLRKVARIIVDYCFDGDLGE